MSRAVYFDYNATAPVLPEAAEAVADALALVGNPSSVHRFGREARRLLEDSRAAVAALVGAAPEELVFTSGGTEANHLALAGAGRTRILVSAIEHPSVLEAAPCAVRIPVGPDGIVDLVALKARLSETLEPALVSIMLANNETGVIQPVAEAAHLAHAHGALVHCDAVQAPGRIRFDAELLGVDCLSLSAHKLGGPKGVGALIVRNDVPLASAFRGGGQERGRRAGTENLPGIAGFAAAARAAERALAAARRVEGLRDRLEARLKARAPELVVVGKNAPRLPNTSCIALPGASSETQVIALDLAGFAVSAGSACSSGKVKASHVLKAMAADDKLAGSAIRVSLGCGTTEAEIEGFVEAWSAMRGRLVAQSAA